MKYFFSLMGLFLFGPPLQAESKDAFAHILDSLNQCYVGTKLEGPAYAKCVLAKLDKVPNPQGYRVFFYEDHFNRSTPSRFKLTITNKKGEVFIWSGIAYKVIAFDNCIAKIISKSVDDQDLSITPPFNESN